VTVEAATSDVWVRQTFTWVRQTFTPKSWAMPRRPDA
jgi:hypothetical protein